MEHNIQPQQPSTKKRKVFSMQAQNFMRVEEVAQELGISKSHAYKVIHKLNAELREKGYLTISGRVNRNFFMVEVLLWQDGKGGLIMAVYKEEKTNTWRVIYRYTDWNGERSRPRSADFKTKREALAWEREQLNKTSADLDMTFESFVDLYTADVSTRLKENTRPQEDAHHPY